MDKKKLFGIGGLVLLAGAGLAALLGIKGNEDDNGTEEVQVNDAPEIISTEE